MQAGSGGGDGSAARPPSGEVPRYGDQLSVAGVDGLNRLALRPAGQDRQRVIQHVRIIGTAADHAAVGGVAVGFVHDHFSLVKAAQGIIVQIEKPVGSRGQAGRQGVAVLVRHLIADQFAEIQHHLLVGGKGLLDLVLAFFLIVEDGELCLRRGAASERQRRTR